MEFVGKLVESLRISFFMFWEVFWPLSLGFLLSSIIQALISSKKVAEVLGEDDMKSASFAAFFGAISSSCSYAAIAIARSLFKKGASFMSSMIFEIASTNLVIELGIVILVLLGWQFALAEIMGGFFMIIILFLIFKLTLRPDLIKEARVNMQKGLLGRMEGHASMDMSIADGPFLKRLFSKEAFTVISHYYVMDWYSVWTDILLGFILAGILSVFVPSSFWNSFFFTGSPSIAFIIGPLVGPLIAIVSFVCSVGNVPLASVLWKGGISFGGAISFIYADLIVLPILNIYRKYYGIKVMFYILLTFFISMAAAGFLVEIIFKIFGLIPDRSSAKIIEQTIQWDYKTIFNLIFILLSLGLIFRFFKTKGLEMLRMMDSPTKHEHHH